MSDSESDGNVKQSKCSGVKFKLKKLAEIEKLESGELCAYISELHELLIKKDNKMKKYKAKYKETVSIYCRNTFSINNFYLFI